MTSREKKVNRSPIYLSRSYPSHVRLVIYQRDVYVKLTSNQLSVYVHQSNQIIFIAEEKTFFMREARNISSEGTRFISKLGKCTLTVFRSPVSDFCDTPLGLAHHSGEKGSGIAEALVSRLPDSAFSASSSYDSASVGPQNAR